MYCIVFYILHIRYIKRKTYSNNTKPSFLYIFSCLLFLAYVSVKLLQCTYICIRSLVFYSFSYKNETFTSTNDPRACPWSLHHTAAASPIVAGPDHGRGAIVCTVLGILIRDKRMTCSKSYPHPLRAFIKKSYIWPPIARTK